MSDTQQEALDASEDTGQEQLEEHQSEQVEDHETSDDVQHSDQDDHGFDREKVLNKVRKLNSENRNLRKAKKEAEEKASKAGEDSERVQALEAVNTRYETLAEHDLPLKIAKWISATDPEGILEQAEELLSLGDRGRKGPPSDTPKERINSSRVSAQQVDEIGDLDDFAEQIYKD